VQEKKASFLFFLLVLQPTHEEPQRLGDDKVWTALHPRLTVVAFQCTSYVDKAIPSFPPSESEKQRTGTSFIS
jgi:hypothetical protein